MRRPLVNLHAGVGWIDHGRKKAHYWFWWKHTSLYPLISLLWRLRHGKQDETLP